MTDDSQLLRRYADERAEDAFAEVVRRHLGWVYRASLRRTGGRSDLAQDVSQYVFTALARQAGALARRDVLAGWLHITVRYAASRQLRSEARRKHHEADAARMSGDEGEAAAADWESIRPFIDRELDRLPGPERDAVLLRFFEGKTFAEIGVRLRIGEDGARRRVERALERMGARLGRAGVTSSAVALAGMLRAEALMPAPLGFQALVTKTAVGTAQGAATAPFMQFMSATKTTWATVALIGLASVAGLSTATVAVVAARRAGQAHAAFAAATARYAARQDQLRQAERAANAAAARLSAAQASHQQRMAAAKNAARIAAMENNGRRRPDTRTLRSDGQAFLTRFAGARDLLLEIGKAQIERGSGVFFRQRNMSPEQIAAFENLTAQHWLDTIEVAPDSIHPGEGDLPEAQLAALLGQDGLQAYRDYERSRPAAGWATGLATTAAQSGAPLSADTIAALTQAVAQNSPEFVNGGSVRPASVDWSKALSQAQQILSPQQWQAVEAKVQLQQLQLQAMKLAGASQPGGKG